MKEYWKAKLIKDLLEIEKGNKDETTITMDYIHYQENMLRLVSQAYEDGWNASVLKDAKCVGDEKMSGIKIIGVKVVGICSKCRKEGDEILKNKDGLIIPDKEISCVNTAFGNCTKDDEVKDGK